MNRRGDIVDFIEFIAVAKEHYQWLFGGLGTSLIAGFLFNKQRASQKQTVKDKSVGIQAGRDVRAEVTRIEKNDVHKR